MRRLKGVYPVRSVVLLAGHYVHSAAPKLSVFTTEIHLHARSKKTP